MSREPLARPPSQVWDASTGTCVLTLEGHSRGISDLCWDHTLHGRYLITASDDTTVGVWDGEAQRAAFGRARDCVGANPRLCHCRLPIHAAECVTCTSKKAYMAKSLLVTSHPIEY